MITSPKIRVPRGRPILLLSLAALVGISLPAPAGAGPEPCLLTVEENRCPDWVSAYDHPGGYGGLGLFADTKDVAWDVAASPDGDRIFVTGQSWDDASRFDVATVAYDAVTGAELWRTRYAGSEGLDDMGMAIEVSPDGGTVFVGAIADWTSDTEGSRPDGHYVTLAYEAATGELIWEAEYRGRDSAHDGLEALAVAPDGSRVYVTGRIDSPSAGFGDYGTVAYDAGTGEELWVSIYSGGEGADGQDWARDIAVSPEGDRVYVTGSSLESSETGFDYATVAYDTATGEQLWMARLHGGVGTDNAFGVGVSPDGSRVFVTGHVASARDPIVFAPLDYATLAYDAETGEEVWESRYSGPGDVHVAFDIAIDPRGEQVYVTGISWGQANDYQLATLAYESATGSEKWASRYGVPGHISFGHAAVEVSPDGSRVYTAGFLAALADSCVLALVGGCFPLMAESHYLTLSNDAATGDRVWAARYNTSLAGHEPDAATSLAIGPDGDRVYVTGTFGYKAGANHAQAFPGVNSADFGTLAYTADS